MKLLFLSLKEISETLVEYSNHYLREPPFSGYTQESTYGYSLERHTLRSLSQNRVSHANSIRDAVIDVLKDSGAGGIIGDNWTGEMFPAAAYAADDVLDISRLHVPDDDKVEKAISAERLLEERLRHLGSITNDPELLAMIEECTVITYRIQTKLSSLLDDLRPRVHYETWDHMAQMSNPDNETEGQHVELWFATNRKNPENSRNFLNARSDTITYGVTSVFVPTDRPIGTLHSGLLRRLVLGNKSVTLVETNLVGSDTFWFEIKEALLRDNLGGVGARTALVFLHGYNVSFRAAAERTAQLKVDLDFSGPALFFSWPSLGKKVGYLSDAAAIQASEGAIREFLVNLASHPSIDKVHIIAHSMGNQGFLRVFDGISKDIEERTQVKFGQIILAAPDVDQNVFLNLAKAYESLSERSTIYVSENDKAIQFSGWINNFPRVGISPPTTVVSGLDTVNVTNVNLDLLGHSHMGLKEFLSDVHALLSHNTPPEQRFGLKKIIAGEQVHWELKP